MKKQKTHIYEGMYIFSSTLSDDARQKALEKITSGITTQNGVIERVFDQGRKKLAYEIDGKKEGYYYLLYFSIPSLAIAPLWRDYLINEDLIRFLTLRVESVPEKIEFKPLVNNE